jgi:hypothetical protein
MRVDEQINFSEARNRIENAVDEFMRRNPTANRMVALSMSINYAEGLDRGITIQRRLNQRRQEREPRFTTREKIDYTLRAINTILRAGELYQDFTRGRENRERENR